MEVTADGRRLAERGDQRVVDVVDLDRREPQPLEKTNDDTGLAYKPRQVVAGVAVAVAAEIDAGEHDLAVALRDAAPDLDARTAGVGGTAPRRAAHERDDLSEKLHEKLPPSWILTNARTRSNRSSAWTQAIAPTSPATKAGVSSLRRATTVTFSGRPANASPARFAPQPVT